MLQREEATPAPGLASQCTKVSVGKERADSAPTLLWLGYLITGLSNGGNNKQSCLNVHIYVPPLSVWP